MSLAPLGFALLIGLGAFDLSPIAHHTARDGEQLVHLDSSKTIVERREDAAAMLVTINAERASRGLAALAYDERLEAIAMQHAQDMATRNYFGHSTPEGISPFERMSRANYRYSYAGENLALDESVVAAGLALWRSIEHRSNILQPHFDRVGIGAVQAADGEIFVEDFSD